MTTNVQVKLNGNAVEGVVGYYESGSLLSLTVKSDSKSIDELLDLFEEGSEVTHVIEKNNRKFTVSFTDYTISEYAGYAETVDYPTHPDVYFEFTRIA